MRELRGHRHSVYSLAFAPDSRTLASGDVGGNLRLWDLDSSSGIPMHDLPGTIHPGRQWDTGTDVLDGVLGSNDPILSLAYSPTGSLLAVGLSRGVLLYDFARWQRRPFTRRLGGSWVVAFPDQDLLALTGYLERRIELCDLEMPHGGRSVSGYRGGVLALASSPGGSRLAAAGGLPGLPELHLWDLGQDGPPVALVGHQQPIYAIAFAPNGRQLVSGSRDGTVRLWDLETGSSRILLTTSRKIVSLAFRPDGRSVLAADESAQIVHLDIGSGARPQTFDWRIGRVRCVAFAPDGMTAAAAGSDIVFVWDVD